MDHGGEQNTSANINNQEKRHFHRHTPEQIQRLEAYFKENPHPDEEQRYNLCQELKLEADQIKFWFQNKRTQSKAQEERYTNKLLRGENQKIQCENEAMLEALKNVTCPPCGGPPFGQEERELNLQKLRLKNAQLKEKRDKLVTFLSKNKEQPTMVDLYGSIQDQQQPTLVDLYGSIQDQQQPTMVDPYCSIQDQQQPTMVEPYGSIQNQQQPTMVEPYGSIQNQQQPTMVDPYGSIQNQQQPTMVDPYGFIQNQQQPTMVDPYGSIQNQQQEQINFDTSIPDVVPDPNNLIDPSNPLEEGSIPQPIQPPLLTDMEIMQLSQIAAIAVEELKMLFFRDEWFWVKSSIDGTYVIADENYKNCFYGNRHFRTVSARVESSKDFSMVPMEARNLIQMFLDSETWKELFPTIVCKANTIYMLGSDFPTPENCNILQVIWEQLHILSPLVSPREFMILRCIQEIEQGLWIVADVSHNIGDFDLMNASCSKRPSGCLIQALPNGLSKVTWIEHVEVDDTSDTHSMYRDILCGRSGYGAKRWLVSLERMCERINLFSIFNIPANDWSELITTAEGRRCVMKIGERMLKSFSEMLTMSGKVDFPQHTKGGVRVAVRMNMEVGIPEGFIVSVASSISLPVTPFEVFNFLRNLNTRQQWDIICFNNVVTEIARIATGPNDTNYVTIIKPIEMENNGKGVAQETDEKNERLMIQDCYMDALGGMIVYSPIDVATMKKAASGTYDPYKTDVLPSGFAISSDGQRRSPAAASSSTATAEECSGSLLTLAYQILVCSKAAKSREFTEASVDMVSSLISTAVQNVKALLLNGGPPQGE